MMTMDRGPNIAEASSHFITAGLDLFTETAGKPLEWTIGDFKFILDSGATDHFIYEPRWFIEINKLTQRRSVGTANPRDHSIFATGWGTIRIPINATKYLD